MSADARTRAAAAALLVYVSLAVLLTADAWTSPTTRWIGGCCDPEQSIWFVRWIPYAIEHLVDPFVTYQINAPAGANLMWNASMPMISLALAPVTLTAGPIFAYNVAIVGSIALSAWCCYFMLRRYASGPIAPLAGGLVYGFSPYLASHAALHLNLSAVWIPPLFVLLLDEIVVRRRHSPRALGAAVGVLAAFQLLMFEEILATTAIGAAVLLVVLGVVAVHRRLDYEDASRRLAQAVVPAGLVFAVMTAWPLAVQFLGPQQITSRVQDIETFSTDLLNAVLPTQYQLFSPVAATTISDQFSGLYHEATGYVGLPLLLVLTAAVAAMWSDLRIRVAGSMAIILFTLSLGPVLQIGSQSTGLPLPWTPLGQAPLLEHALPGRMTLYMWLAIAVIVTIMTDALLRLNARRAVPGFIVLAVALAVAAPAPIRSSSVEIPVFFHRWEAQGIRDDAIILMAPYFTNGAGADPMLWAAVAGDAVRMYEAYAYVPLPDGSPSYGPPPTELSRTMQTIQDNGDALVARGEVRAQIERDLTESGITDVIVGPMRYRPQMITFFADLFGRSPTEVDGVALWRDVHIAGVVTAR